VDGSAGAAVEFALNALSVRDIVVCGHSECGAMRALGSGTLPAGSPTLERWLATGKDALARLAAGEVGAELPEHDRLSQVSVLQQLDNLRTYPAVRERIELGAMTLHAWWFDLARAEVLVHDAAARRFVPLGAEE
jgi:carbonic anhydrase